MVNGAKPSSQNEPNAPNAWLLHHMWHPQVIHDAVDPVSSADTQVKETPASTMMSHKFQV
jgi:hypothetical protein